MKTFNNLFDKIISFKNLLLATRKAQKGKRFKNSTSRFNFHLEKEIFLLQEELTNMTYRHGGYRDFFISDPKRRLISAAPYRDRVVHHALCNIIEPIFDKRFIDDTYACRKGKGAHSAVNRYSEYVQKNVFVLKCDIVKYFQSIDHTILFETIFRRITCPKTRWLIQLIISSRSDKSNYLYFQNDNLFSPFDRKKGIPIGNLTSQIFANIYLDGFDHFIKEECRAPYIRYVDDFVVFGNSKEQLKIIRKKMEEFLSSLRLRLHERKSRVYRVTDGVNFLGYRIYPTHRRVNKGNVLRMKRKLKKLREGYQKGEVPFSRLHQSIQSWIGHASHANSYKLRERIFSNMIFIRETTGGTARRFVDQQ